MHMKTKEAVQERILQLCNEHNTNIHALARCSGISPSTLKSIIYGSSLNPGIVTIKIICDGLGISLIDFFDCELFQNLEQEIE